MPQYAHTHCTLHSTHYTHYTHASVVVWLDLVLVKWLVMKENLVLVSVANYNENRVTKMLFL
jgi:hypothetical protein